MLNVRIWTMPCRFIAATKCGIVPILTERLTLHNQLLPALENRPLVVEKLETPNARGNVGGSVGGGHAEPVLCDGPSRDGPVSIEHLGNKAKYLALQAQHGDSIDRCLVLRVCRLRRSGEDIGIKKNHSPRPA